LKGYKCTFSIFEKVRQGSAKKWPVVTVIVNCGKVFFFKKRLSIKVNDDQSRFFYAKKAPGRH
jgi:hypothetical protein